MTLGFQLRSEHLGNEEGGVSGGDPLSAVYAGFRIPAHVQWWTLNRPILYGPRAPGTPARCRTGSLKGRPTGSRALVLPHSILQFLWLTRSGTLLQQAGPGPRGAALSSGNPAWAWHDFCASVTGTRRMRWETQSGQGGAEPSREVGTHGDSWEREIWTLRPSDGARRATVMEVAADRGTA